MADVVTREAKRPRTEAEEVPAEDEVPLWEQDPAAYVKAQDVIRLRFVPSKQDAREGHTFAPEYVHQMLGKEALALPEAERPLMIHVLYAESSLELFLTCDRKMTGAVEETMYKLASALPAMCATQDALLEAALRPSIDTSALGDVVKTYTPRDSITANSSEYEVRCGALHDSAARASFNERLQSVLRFFIENHSPIDAADERWRLFTLFERRGDGTCAFVGAATVFAFQRWVAKAEAAAAGTTAGPKLLLRVCQILVLPPWQGGGHGAQLLNSIYEYAKTHDALEVSVEDPSPQCRLLRDLTDTRNAQRLGLLVPTPVGAPVSAAELKRAKAAMRTTDEQLHRCYEVKTYVQLLGEMSGMAEGSAEREAKEKPYRLALKRRLNKKHEEDLAALDLPPADADQQPPPSALDPPPPKPKPTPNVEARKAKLEELYKELIAEYSVLAKRLMPPADPLPAQ